MEMERRHSGTELKCGSGERTCLKLEAGGMELYPCECDCARHSHTVEAIRQRGIETLH
jgi:hypothetical protein